MTENNSQKRREEWIIDYLYGELNSEQRAVFEQTLDRDRQLKILYDEHVSIDRLIPKGSRAIVGDDRLQGVRWAALRGIRNKNNASLLERFLRVWNTQVPMKVQLASMVLMFSAGLMISSVIKHAEENVAVVETGVENFSALQFVKNSDYRIVDMTLDHYDSNKSDIQFSFAIASQSHVQGNLGNPQIRDFLAQTLNAGVNDDVRLSLSELLGTYAHSKHVKEALIDSLLNDVNPGVRYNAVEHLVKIAEQGDVRQALLHAMVYDVNPGIRVQAFLRLTENPDDKILNILSQYSVKDANALIRERSKQILDGNTVFNGQAVDDLFI